ncbi:MAG: hypothetical protein EHM61_21095 [Acidobacteria bacterium]|nr:MAG: hypothetical protein EHM61_21095 [Acidobacteriota bacterium]
MSQVRPPGASFAPLPPGVSHALKPANLERTYRDFLARVYTVQLWRSQIFKVVSQPGESDRDFRIRLAQMSRERRDFELDKLRQRYASKFDTLNRQEASARMEVDRQQQQLGEQKMHTAISVGAGLLGALLGGSRIGTIGRATTVARGATRVSREKQDIDRANVKLQEVQQRKALLEEQVRQEADRLVAGLDPQLEMLQEIQIRPKKTDILIRGAGLLWVAE